MSHNDHLIPDGPARIASADRIATVICDDISAWDALASLTAFETTPGGDWGIGNSGLQDLAQAGAAIRHAKAVPTNIPEGSASCRVYLRNRKRRQDFMAALEMAGAVRIPDAHQPHAIYIPATLARDMAAQL